MNNYKKALEESSTLDTLLDMTLKLSSIDAPTISVKVTTDWSYDLEYPATTQIAFKNKAKNQEVIIKYNDITNEKEYKSAINDLDNIIYLLSEMKQSMFQAYCEANEISVKEALTSKLPLFPYLHSNTLNNENRNFI